MSDEVKRKRYKIQLTEFEMRYIANRLLEQSQMDHTTPQEQSDLEYWAHRMLYIIGENDE